MLLQLLHTPPDGFIVVIAVNTSVHLKLLTVTSMLFTNNHVVTHTAQAWYLLIVCIYVQNLYSEVLLQKFYKNINIVLLDHSCYQHNQLKGKYHFHECMNILLPGWNNTCVQVVKTCTRQFTLYNTCTRQFTMQTCDVITTCSMHCTVLCML